MKRIVSIEVNNSSFFIDHLKLDFSRNLNCIMGGRGTGKSTLLYFIQSSLEPNSEENININSILHSNLENGIIRLVITDDNDNEFEIVKTYGEIPQSYILPAKKHISQESLHNYFDCDIYPALAIEEIGKNSPDRLQLVDKRVRNEVKEIKKKIRDIQISLNQSADLIRNENARLKEIRNQIIEFGDVEGDLLRHKEAKPADIKQEEQIEFEKADEKEKIRDAEKRFVSNILDKLIEYRSNLLDDNDDIKNFISIKSELPNHTNKEIINSVYSELHQVLVQIFNDNQRDISLIDKSLIKIKQFINSLDNLHEKQQNEFIKLKQKFDVHREYINRYNRLSKNVNAKLLLIKQEKEIKSRIWKLKKERESHINNLNIERRNIFNLRKSVIDKLNLDLEGSVKITLTFGGITDEYENLLRNSLRGSNLRYNAIVPYITQNLSPDRFASAIHNKDLETLSEVIEIDKQRSSAIIEALSETEDIYKIESIYCDDLPEFFLKIDSKGDSERKDRILYKKSQELSTGQRCTAVLPIIFAISENPLIIDQPEDNLDNKYITETIHKIIRNQKQFRQLIFITHNPNIPVLSDSEFNIFLTYENKKSIIESSGKVMDVKSNILNLLEGGKEAFERRKTLYGE